MTVLGNRAMERLRNGELAIGLGLRQARTPDIALIAKACDHDWLYIDMEHNAMSMETAVDICVGAIAAGITPVVRVPGHQHFHASRVLDGGAMGIQVPHVNTAEQARQAVINCRFPPVGHRSIYGSYPQLGFEPMPIADAARILNENTIVSVMIETPEAVENIEAIAAVEGVDIVYMGTNDLLSEMNLHGQFDHPVVEKTCKRVIRACKANGKYAGLGGIRDPNLIEKYIVMGVRWLTSQSDLGYLVEGAMGRAKTLRSIKLD